MLSADPVSYKLTHDQNPSNSDRNTTLEARTLLGIFLDFAPSFSATGRKEENTICAPDPLTSYPKALRFLLIIHSLFIGISLLPTW